MENEVDIMRGDRCFCMGDNARNSKLVLGKCKGVKRQMGGGSVVNI